MSVRAIAIRNSPRPLAIPAVPVHVRLPARGHPRRSGRLGSARLPHRRGVWRELADDQQLIGVKIILLGLLALAAMALEVPL